MVAEDQGGVPASMTWQVTSLRRGEASAVRC